MLTIKATMALADRKALYRGCTSNHKSSDGIDMRNFALLFAAFALIHGDSAGELVAQQLQFNRDIRPILSDRCFLCHGPDQSSEQAKETDLRLDDRQSVIELGIVDFDDVDESEILARIRSDDPGDQMPPPGSHKKRLTTSEVDTIRKWISQGADYQEHWAFIPPTRPASPKLTSASDVERVQNPIDAFVLDRLATIKKQKPGLAAQLTPAQPADRATLIRRVTFDLTGLPPTVAEVDSFVQDPQSTNAAYEKVVDRLLASPRYGEQRARFWMDAARYADTSGYQYDREREQWVWRDWVIHAFNTDMPFDQFTIQQLAGDMLPDATDQTRLASGFNRNHPITIEGGVVDEEYRTEYVIDRVVTTSTVWMGQTFLCARCHDHKYDPISQKNFYEFYSFFNNVPEKGLNGFDPKLNLPSPLAQTRIAYLKIQLANIESEIRTLDLPYQEWEQRWQQNSPVWSAVKPDSVVSSGGATSSINDDGEILFSGTNPETDDYELTFTANEYVRSIRLAALTDPSLTNQSASRGSNGNFVLTEFIVESAPPVSASDAIPEFSQQTIASAQADYEQAGFPIEKANDGGHGKTSGWAVDGNTKPENRLATFALEKAIPKGSTIRVRLLHRYGLSHQIGKLRLSVSPQSPVASATDLTFSVPPKKRTDAQTEAINRYLVQEFADGQSRALVELLNATKSKLDAINQFPETMVMSEMPTPRQAYVLDRGEYDKPRTDDPVAPGVPPKMGSLGKFPANRLGLAQWLVSPDQPLTARVTVNRFWQQLFGVGLVRTSEDFGAQGEYPSHPELLDWLAVEFMESGWDVKQILKTMVMSGTYRQSSVISTESFSGDPDNRWLSRGPRIRLDGEAIRDAALAVGGLLKPTVGGPSVYPYHPDGLWLEINNRPNYSRAYPHQTDVNQLYRRSLYTYWKRTVPPPSVATFDAPSREYCIVRRSRTNTPLQAFVMLHDPQFVEAARNLAARMLTEGGQSLDSKIRFGFKACTAREPTTKELSILQEAFEAKRIQFQAEIVSVERVLTVGASKVNADLDSVELAAMTEVARMLMNLSEFLTKG